MLLIVEILQSTYLNKSPKTISNIETQNFLNLNKSRFDNDSFKEIKDYFLVAHKVSRSILQSGKRKIKFISLQRNDSKI